MSQTTVNEQDQAELERWQQRMDASLRAEDGWLSLVGLFWLREGDNLVGSDADSDVLLPADKVPAQVGVLAYRDGAVTLSAAAGVELLVNDQPVTQALLQDDSEGKPDIVRLGSVSFFIIARAGRYGVRARDADSEQRRNFTGRQWRPINDELRLEARYQPYDPPKLIPIATVTGDLTEEPSPGAVVFEVDGQEYRLDANPSHGKGLFLVFRDATSGHGSYPASRFLFTDAPQDGKVVLDFNRAVSPPCAFTDYATCPLPPPGNQLPIAIEAGELYESHY